jgi:superfamily II DNA helicase RecQ
MRIRFFTIPIKNTEDAETEVNRFLVSHRILTVDRRFVENGENSFWTLAVEYLRGADETRDDAKPGRPRVDYKEVLTPEDFAVFSRLRDLRKKLAETEAVPVYAVLTNEQLAAIANARPASQADLLRIEGVGEAKAGKYGERVLGVVREAAT